MKLAVIFDPNDHKLRAASYSQTYKYMLDAIIEHPGWDEVQIITTGLGVAPDVDVIVVYDIHSSYHAEFPGLSNHKALKYTYFNDPHQTEMKGQYKDGTLVNKLGIKDRVRRAMDRNMDFIICPYKDGYRSFLAPEIGKHAEHMLFWFPVAPKLHEFANLPITERKQGVLGNGHLWEGVEGFRPYKFRNWAYRRENVDYVKHCLADDRVPSGDLYIEFLSKWKAGLALTDWYVVPKYLEIPLAGCVCFAQRHTDYDDMGFIPENNYVAVDENNFDERMKHFVDNVDVYQYVADAGKKLVEENYTASHFAEALFKHAEEKV
ncbi:glycosyltransferase family 1 protein [Candidatus Pacearchaeota archaeon]|nr:glycosyltransferase family 1 protein [Candidatus Pacearchaeota archaeon]